MPFVICTLVVDGTDSFVEAVHGPFETEDEACTQCLEIHGSKLIEESRDDDGFSIYCLPEHQFVPGEGNRYQIRPLIVPGRYAPKRAS